MGAPLGVLTQHADLPDLERKLVWMTDFATENAYVPRSNFPVGAAILAENMHGEQKMFSGCNVENRYFPPTICAERNAGTTAVAQGFRKFRAVCVFCKKVPGGSPCGLCRQFLTEFGCDALLLNICDKEKNVRRATVGDLLPGAADKRIEYGQQSLPDRRLITSLLELRSRSYVPYSKAPRAAFCVAANQDGRFRKFPGVSDDNASYGGSATAECVAMRTARTAGYTKNVKLVATVGPDASAHNPIDGEALQVLREFGILSTVILVADDRSVVLSSVDELLPDSFGPEALAP